MPLGCRHSSGCTGQASPRNAAALLLSIAGRYLRVDCSFFLNFAL